MVATLLDSDGPVLGLGMYDVASDEEALSVGSAAPDTVAA